MSAEAVTVRQCWGCNRLAIPKPWTTGTLALLRSEGRLRLEEGACGRPKCPVNVIANGRTPAALTEGGATQDRRERGVAG